MNETNPKSPHEWLKDLLPRFKMTDMEKEDVFFAWLKTTFVMSICNLILSVVLALIMSGLHISGGGVLVCFLFIVPYYLCAPCVIAGVIAYIKLLRKDQEKAAGMLFALLTPFVYVAIIIMFFKYFVT